MLRYIITETDHCRRADSFLHNILPDAPLSYRKKLIAAGHLRINDAVALADTALRLTDTVTLKESEKTTSFLAQLPPRLDLLYEDSWLMVFNKPAGLAMHDAAEVDANLVDQGSDFFRERGGEGKLRPVNRLDRGTSGVVILAKSSSAAGMFGRFVKEEGLTKLYLAVVDGSMEPDGTIAAPLDGKEALTRYRLLFQGVSQALVALYPLTGRMHQLRQHLSLIGHPIRGDRRYGGSPLAGCEGHALHSFATVFFHPAKEERVTVRAPLPAALVSLVKEFAGSEAGAIMAGLAELPLE